MKETVVKINGQVVDWGIDKTPSRWTGELEESRVTLINKFTNWFVPSLIMAKLTIASSTHVFAKVNASEGADKLRDGFSQLLDVFTAISEPILWFYALTACIMIATKNKQAGWDRLKQVGYAYAAIALLPTFFAFLRWVAQIVKSSISF